MILGVVTRLTYILMSKSSKNIEFLHWLKNRLRIKYSEEDSIVYQTIDSIITEMQSHNEVNNKKILKICKKMHPFFENEKDENSVFDIGYSKKEKLHIYKYITDVIKYYYE